MAIQTVQFDSVGTNHQANEYNEAWTVMDEENYRREVSEWLDIDFDTLQLDSDRLPF